MTAETWDASERARLESIASSSWYAEGSNGAAAHYAAKVFRRLWRGSRALELGPAEGMITQYLEQDFSHVTAVDGSLEFCRALANILPTVEVVCTLFEEFQPSEPYDSVVLGHVLEHVDDPDDLLRRIRDWTNPGALLFAAVPNSHSLHRQLGVLLGMLDSEHSQTPRDFEIGHRRIYDRDTLGLLFRNAGYEVISSGGFWLKPISTGQIDEQWSPELIDASLELGELYPDIAAEIYVVAQSPAD